MEKYAKKGNVFLCLLRSFFQRLLNDAEMEKPCFT